MNRRELIGMAGVGVVALAGAVGFGLSRRHGDPPARAYPFRLDDRQWRARLTPAAYHILRQSGTEPPFSSPLLAEHRPGFFACAGCAQPAFDAATKYDSGTGWPSFWAPIEGRIETRQDGSLGMVRTEVRCARCGGHLGHVFDDGPKPTGMRYCLNGAALTFAPAGPEAKA